MSELHRSPRQVKSKITFFLAGFVVAGCIVAAVAVVLQKRLRDRHADCPLDANEAFLKSWSALSDAERAKLESTFQKFTTTGSYPIVASRIGEATSLIAVYELGIDDDRRVAFAAQVLGRFKKDIEAASADPEMYRIRPQIETTTATVDAFLERHPEVAGRMK